MVATKNSEINFQILVKNKIFKKILEFIQE